MPLLSVAAEVLLSMVATAENATPSHCHTRSLVTPSGRTESTSPQPNHTVRKQHIGVEESVSEVKKDKDLGSSCFL